MALGRNPEAQELPDAPAEDFRPRQALHSTCSRVQDWLAVEQFWLMSVRMDTLLTVVQGKA